MGITVKQARDAQASCADVFTTEGDAGVISRISERRGAAYVTGRELHCWVPLADLDTAETLRTR